jgi:hypothetical protein
MYHNYVWRHVDDESFLDDMKDGEYERFSEDWKYESDLLDKFIKLLKNDYVKYENEREEIIKYFKEKMIEMNEESSLEPDDLYYNDVDNINFDSIQEYIENNCTNDDAKELIETFNFEEKIIEDLVDDYMDNFSDAEDYVGQMYGDTKSKEAISYVERYIKYQELAKDIVEDMDEEELRNYL